MVYPLELNRIEIFSKTSTNISFFPLFLLWEMTEFSIAFELFVFLLKKSKFIVLFFFFDAIGSLTINGLSFSVVII